MKKANKMIDDIEKKKELIEIIKKFLAEMIKLEDIKSIMFYASNGHEKFDFVQGNTYEMIGFMEDAKHKMLNNG